MRSATALPLMCKIMAPLGALFYIFQYMKSLIQILFLSASLLLAQNIDESVIGGSKNLTLDDALCKGCEILRYDSTDSTSCESCANYVNCNQDGDIVTYSSGPMGSWTNVESVVVSKGDARSLPKCKLRFSSNLKLRLGMTKSEVLKTGLYFRRTSDKTWEWMSWSRLEESPDEAGNDWHEWQGRTLEFCNEKLCSFGYWCSVLDSGPSDAEIKEFSKP